jgi:hypothetical protein
MMNICRCSALAPVLMTAAKTKMARRARMIALERNVIGFSADADNAGNP